MDTKGYPEEEELRKMRRWKFEEWQDVLDLLDYVRERWFHPGHGFILKGKNVLRLKLHTYGWSGSESIIGALMDNAMFWMLFWKSSRRGGHHVFEIRKSIFK